jgi:hypothetical protein
MIIKTRIWFATQIERDHKTGHNGDGIRLYCNDDEDEYKIITGISFDGNVLQVKDSYGVIINLDNEPDNKRFENTLFRDWKIWDNEYGEYYEETRFDYEPWVYDSLTTLAIYLGVDIHKMKEHEYNTV